jgi:uncharacterized DUF497 family protein
MPETPESPKDPSPISVGLHDLDDIFHDPRGFSVRLENANHPYYGPYQAHVGSLRNGTLVYVEWYWTRGDSRAPIYARLANEEETAFYNELPPPASS